MGNGDLHAVGECSAMYASHGDATEIRRVVERRDEHLGCAVEIFRGGNHLENFVEQIGDVVGRCVVVLAHPSLLRRTVDDGEVELVFRGAEGKHEVEHHLVDLLRAAVRLIDLIHHHDGLQSYLQCFLQHEARLRHRSFEGVDEQQAAVGHVEHTLHLSAEVTMSRSVDDVNLYTLIGNRHVLRENGYTALSLKVVAVEHLIAHLLTFTEQVTGHHHLIDEGRLAMVYMGYYCYVSDILHIHFTKNRVQSYEKSSAIQRKKKTLFYFIAETK